MPYDKTIAGDDFTFDAVLSTTPRILLDILSAGDKQELLNALYTNGNTSQPMIRGSVDGWIYSSTDFYTSHKIGGAFEVVQAGERYPMPVYQWHRKRMFYGTEGQAVKIRVVCSANYSQRGD